MQATSWQNFTINFTSPPHSPLNMILQLYVLFISNFAVLEYGFGARLPASARIRLSVAGGCRILFTNSFSTFPPIKRHFSPLFFAPRRILSILFYVQYLHKIIKKMCFWGNEKKQPERERARSRVGEWNAFGSRHSTSGTLRAFTFMLQPKPAIF